MGKRDDSKNLYVATLAATKTVTLPTGIAGKGWVQIDGKSYVEFIFWSDGTVTQVNESVMGTSDKIGVTSAAEASMVCIYNNDGVITIKNGYTDTAKTIMYHFIAIAP